MRTTLVLEDDVYAAARQIAENSGRSLGKVISQLARKGLAAEPSFDIKNGAPVFRVGILQSGFLETEQQRSSLRRIDDQVLARR